MIRVHVECLRRDGKRLYLIDSAADVSGFGWTTARENRAVFPYATAARVLASLPRRPDTGAPAIVAEESAP